METLRVLGVVVVCSAEQFDGQCIVEEGVELWKVEVRPDFEVNKD
jgi:hypothetical protein